MAELRRHFRPEFLNRVDEIVLFKPLTQAEIERIVDLMFNDLRARLADRRMTRPGGRPPSRCRTRSRDTHLGRGGAAALCTRLRYWRLC